jgi:hypothetical protein
MKHLADKGLGRREIAPACSGSPKALCGTTCPALRPVPAAAVPTSRSERWACVRRSRTTSSIWRAARSTWPIFTAGSLPTRLRRQPSLGAACGFRRFRTPISTQVEQAFRAMPNTTSGRCRTRRGARERFLSYDSSFVKPERFLRIDSPLSLSSWALCTSRSSSASAIVGSPTRRCHSFTGS